MPFKLCTALKAVEGLTFDFQLNGSLFATKGWRGCSASLLGSGVGSGAGLEFSSSPTSSTSSSSSGRLKVLTLPLVSISMSKSSHILSIGM